MKRRPEKYVIKEEYYVLQLFLHERGIRWSVWRIVGLLLYFTRWRKLGSEKMVLRENYKDVSSRKN